MTPIARPYLDKGVWMCTLHRSSELFFFSPPPDILHVSGYRVLPSSRYDHVVLE
jgi:hypothetical protein